MATMTNCPYCGKLTDPKLDSCPHCGGQLQRASSPPQKADSGRQGQTCPNCHALVQHGDIICVACGTNLLTGQRITEQAQPGEATRKFKVWVIAAVVAIFVVLACVGTGLYLMSRNDLDQAIQLITAGHISEGNQLLEQYVAENPDDARAHLELGKLQWRTSQWQKAADSFEKVTNLRPRNREAFLLAVVSSASAGDGRPRQKEIKLLQRFVKEHPDEELGWYLLGLARGAGNNVAGQIEALNQALALNPSDPTRRQHLGIAVALQGDYGQAERELSAALLEDPDNGDILAAMGIVAQLQNNHEKAAGQLTDALDKGTAIENQAFIQLGLMLLARGQSEEALSHFSKVLARDETDPTAAFFYAVCLQTQGLESDALKEYQSISEGSGPYAKKAAIQAAQIHLGRDDMVRADQALDQAERLGEKGPAWFTLRGRVQAKLGETGPAQDMFKRAIRADPAYAPAHLENGLLYVKRRAFSEGIRELRRYLGLVDPTVEGARTEEIQALIEQLRQASAMVASS